MDREHCPASNEAVETAILKRRSVRNFSNQDISDEVYEKLIRAGVYAPSGSNWQNQRFLIVKDPDEINRIGQSRFVWPYLKANIDKIKEHHPAGILGKAKGLIIVFSDSSQNDRRENGEYHIWQNLEIQNCAASIQNILIMATSLKLATCWVSASDTMNFTRLFSKQSWRQLLSNYDIPLHYKLQGIVICGYPKRVDEAGYPKGEKKHGATVWQDTQRKPNEAYLIHKRDSNNPSIETCPTTLDRLIVRTLSLLIRCSRTAASVCDRIIHKIEIKKYLKP